MGHAATSNPAVQAVLRGVAEGARHAGVFAEVQESATRVQCTAKNCPEPAWYRVESQADGLWVSLVTPHRYLSQSIEADLVHTGDKLQELVSDELLNLGFDGFAPAVEHFRSPDMLFTFRSHIPARAEEANAAKTCLTFLLAYEACFRCLGDMGAAGEGA